MSATHVSEKSPGVIDSGTEPIRAADIQMAQARISSVIAPTPLEYCPRLSEETGVEVYLKREDLQDVRSYKIRGALNSGSQLSRKQRDAVLLFDEPFEITGWRDDCSRLLKQPFDVRLELLL